MKTLYHILSLSLLAQVKPVAIEIQKCVEQQNERNSSTLHSHLCRKKHVLFVHVTEEIRNENFSNKLTKIFCSIDRIYCR